MKGFVGAAVVAIVGFADVARAQAVADWRGGWQLGGGTRSRVVEDAGNGRVALTVEVEGVPVRCEGLECLTVLSLRGTVQRTPGLVGVLRGDGEPRGAINVHLEVRPGGTDPRDGRLVADARLFVGARLVGEERWMRPGPAGLEILEVRTPARTPEYAPTQGTLEMSIRVLGRPQDVDVDVIVSPEGESDPRPAFYGHNSVTRQAPVARFGGKLEVGRHTLTWKGRDLTKDERFLLAGEYRLRVDSPERRAAVGPRGEPAPERKLRVSKPRALVQMPFEQGAQPVASSLDGPFQVSRPGAMTGAQTLDALKRSAVMLVDTHGGKTGFMTGTDQFVNRPMIPRDKQLADVHTVFITACETGTGGHGGLPGDLLSAGVDVVVAMNTRIVARETEYFHAELGPRLIKYGAPIERVVKESADESYSKYWGWLGDMGQLQTLATAAATLGGALAGWLSDALVEEARRPIQKARPIRDVVGVFCAPGIDPQTETLMPARHGCSTN